MSVSSGGGGQEVELNLAPIIDCFTVLIAFMLVSASFLSIGLLDAGIAAAGPSNDKSVPPPISVEVVIQNGLALQVKISGKETRTLNVNAKDRALDLDGLAGQLKPIQEKWKTVTGATISAENDVEYKEVIRTMEATRKHFPAVALGGL
jgi:biopolymer transport protein ExbD